MTVASNIGRQSTAKDGKKQKPQKIVTPKEAEEKKQECLKKQRESDARRRKSKKAEKVELTPDLTPAEKSAQREKQQFHQRRNSN
jgi:hypothetical protein